MALSLKQYDQLISRLDEYARRNPRAYRFRVTALAAMGYAYIVFVLAIALALIAVMIVLLLSGHFAIFLAKLGFVCIAFVWLILKSLRVHFPEPDGIPLQRGEYPALYAMIDRIARKLDAPRLHHILLNDDFNAAIAQRPRLGILGWQVNYLILGLPLMQALTPEQFESVVAHEFGHLSGNHGRFGGWIYRVRRTWANILSQLENRRGRGEFALRPFVEWYAPYFNAYSFVLARMDEYVADRCSAELVGAETAAQALIAGRIRGMMLRDAYASELREKNAILPEPPPGVTNLIYSTLRAAPPAAQSARWLSDALRVATDNDDTHPSLNDRLTALKYPMDARVGIAEQPVIRSAADELLGVALPQVAEQLDAAWRAARAEGWRRQHERIAKLREAVDAANASEAEGALTAEQAKSRAYCMAELATNDDALPYFRQAVEMDPSDASTQYSLGCALLDAGDPAGEEHLRRAVQLEPQATLSASERLQAFWAERGDTERAATFKELKYSAHADAVAANKERASYKPGDPVLPNGLSPEEIAPITELMASEPGIYQALLVRKAVRYFADSQPFYVLQIIAYNGLFTYDGAGKRRKLLDRIRAQGRWPGKIWLRVVDGRERPLKRIRRDIPGAVIYTRPKR